MKPESILEPATFDKIKTCNRLVRSATCEYMAGADGRPVGKLIELYNQLAQGNIGVVITGFSYVLPNGRSNPGQTGIYSDDLIPDWQKISSLFSQSPSLLLMQIVHGGRQVRAKTHEGPVWAPSAVPDTVYKTEPREMTTEEIETLIDAFVRAAVRAEEAGFDGIQLHAAHGYLLSQFLSPYTNRRDDAYGGNQEKRCRIVVDIIKKIKAKVDDRFIIAAKINGQDFVGGGMTLNQAVETAKGMARAGLDFLEVSGGMGEARNSTIKTGIESIEQEGYFRHHGRAIRDAVGIPTAVVGGFRTLGLMDETVKSGAADFISLSRPFIREPDLALKFSSREANRAACRSCSRCFNPRGICCKHLS